MQLSEKPVRVAVVIGSHNYDVPAFRDLFEDMQGVDYYLQDPDNLAADLGNTLDAYDVVLFYNMHRDTPTGSVGDCLAGLGDRDRGIVVLHHALLAYAQWPVWSELVGIADRSFDYSEGETVTTVIADGDHPITAGLSDWTMIDETYQMASAGSGSRVLLTTQHPKSMRTLGWTRMFGRARVFCYEGGHDRDAFEDKSFRTVLRRGILWAAGLL